MPRRTLLLDFHGVVSDARRLGTEWRRLLGVFLAPRFGGEPDAWGQANRRALQRQLERLEGSGVIDGSDARRRADRIRWLRDMLDEVGVSGPADDDEVDAVATHAMAFVTANALSAIPGAVGALRALHRRGFALYTASGDDSRNLHGYLEALEVRALFTETYGSNLLGIPKNGPRYLEALVAHARIDPLDAIYVDDDPVRLEWARALGIDTVLVASESTSDHTRITSLAELPAILP